MNEIFSIIKVEELIYGKYYLFKEIRYFFSLINSKFHFQIFCQVNVKLKKTEENVRRKKKDSLDDEDEMDMDSMDWWSKYFASVETLIRVGVVFMTTQ